MASWRALRYALLALSPVSSQGMYFGLGIAWAAALFSPFLGVPAPFRPTLGLRGPVGAGDGDIFTMSASVLGTKFSLCP